MINNIKIPWSIQIEFTEGCSRLCNFCGLNGIRDKAGNFKHMTPELGKILAKQVAEFMPERRVEFAMHGEPTMNPNYLELISTFRKALPTTQLQITTNGVRFLKHDMVEEMNKIFDAGIDFIVLDTYMPEKTILDEKIRWAKKKTGKIEFIDFYKTGGDPSPWHNHHRKLTNTVIVMDDLGARDGEVKSRVIYNHAGNNKSKPRMKDPLKKKCTLPFREISVCWDGTVNLCCQDWKHEFEIDNVKHTHLKDIWTSKRFEAGRAFLANKKRNMKPCNVCDIGSGSRSGLIAKYPTPTKEQAKIVGAL